MLTKLQNIHNTSSIAEITKQHKIIAEIKKHDSKEDKQFTQKNI